jgi:hypothetical protein
MPDPDGRRSFASHSAFSAGGRKLLPNIIGVVVAKAGPSGVGWNRVQQLTLPADERTALRRETCRQS